MSYEKLIKIQLHIAEQSKQSQKLINILKQITKLETFCVSDKELLMCMRDKDNFLFFIFEDEVFSKDKKLSNIEYSYIKQLLRTSNIYIKKEQNKLIIVNFANQEKLSFEKMSSLNNFKNFLNFLKYKTSVNIDFLNL
ncbi:MAG: hypothetical protein N2505_00380 [Endomicrobia bacterium]|nr:hypothetical protein [Endomicrobiia bacterium]